MGRTIVEDLHEDPESTLVGQIYMLKHIQHWNLWHVVPTQQNYTELKSHHKAFEEAVMYMCPTIASIICKMQKPCDGRQRTSAIAVNTTTKVDVNVLPCI